MFLDLIDCDASLWLRDKYLVQKVPQTHADELVVLWLALLDVVVDLGRTISLEWRLPAYYLGHQDANAPDVCLEAVSGPP